jgi:hypothetical protein
MTLYIFRSVTGGVAFIFTRPGLTGGGGKVTRNTVSLNIHSVDIPLSELPDEGYSRTGGTREPYVAVPDCACIGLKRARPVLPGEVV